jgi:hypothetical protein
MRPNAAPGFDVIVLAAAVVVGLDSGLSGCRRAQQPGGDDLEVAGPAEPT